MFVSTLLAIFAGTVHSTTQPLYLDILYFFSRKLRNWIDEKNKRASDRKSVAREKIRAANEKVLRLSSLFFV